MKFTKTECTESTLAALKAPADLEERIKRDPVGCPCVYSASYNAALFANPWDHSTHPDQAFTLVVDGQVLWVWEEMATARREHRVTVHLNKETEHLEDRFLEDLLHHAFVAWKETEQFSIPVVVRNRSNPPKEPRSPEDIIVAINKFFGLMPAGRETLAIDLFVPALVRPEEVSRFVAFGQRTDFAGLEPEVRSFFDVALKALSEDENRT